MLRKTYPQMRTENAKYSERKVATKVQKPEGSRNRIFRFYNYHFISLLSLILLRV